MAKSRFDDFDILDEEQEFLPTDAADQVFWDEFYRREQLRDEHAPLVTIIIKNQETGEEKVMENVRLRFRSVKKLQG